MSAALARNGRLGIARYPPHSCRRELLAPSRNRLPAPRSRSSGPPMPSSGHCAGRANDHSNRPALWDRFYALDWGDTTTNNYGYAPAEATIRSASSTKCTCSFCERLEGRARDPARPEAARSELRPRRRPACAARQAPEIDATGLDIARKRRALLPRHLWRKRAAPLRPGERPPPALPRRQLRCRAERRGVERLWRPPRVSSARRRRVLKPDGLLLYADTVKHGRREAIEQDLASAASRRSFATSPATSPRPAGSTASAGAR